MRATWLLVAGSATLLSVGGLLTVQYADARELESLFVPFGRGMCLVGAIHLLLTLPAYQGRNWARILLTIVVTPVASYGLVLLVSWAPIGVLNLFSGRVDLVVPFLVPLGPCLLAAGVLLLHRPDSRHFFAHRG